MRPVGGSWGFGSGCRRRRGGGLGRRRGCGCRRGWLPPKSCNPRFPGPQDGGGEGATGSGNRREG
ncbi:MAG: hypothetical protein COY42_19030, partial [Armatimonadetes bacterium CG_4_10_14_0_8_um_filter_66_14]